MSFTPTNEDTAKILQLLKESRSPVSAEHNASIQQQLETYNKMQDFNCYLAYILCNLKQETEEIRSVAGLLLKNNIQTFYPQLTESLKYLEQNLLQNLLDPSKNIRQTTSNCIATITRTGTFTAWFQHEINLPQCLCQLLDSGDANGIDGALNTIVKICEDSFSELDMEMYGRPVTFLVPKLVQFLGHSDETARRHSLHALVQLMQSYTICEEGGGIFNAILTHLDALLQGIFKLANEQNLEIRKDVCRAFVCLLETYHRLKPFIKDVITYMMAQTQAEDEALALEACEFWSSIAEMEVAVADIKPYIPQLLPILLKGMIYSEFDRSVLGGDDDDCGIADKEDAIHPHLINKAAKSRVHAQHRDDDDDDDDAEVSEWNLRKCSASSLDVFSSMYGDPLLETLLPMIQERMSESQPWEVRESAVLALGAIAEGCYSGMRPHLNQLVPYLITLLNREPKPLVRSITCWTLSRYSRWVVTQSPDPKQYFEPLLQALMVRVLDNNKNVQEAACSAFATLEEEARTDLIPYLKPIVECLVQAFDKYQAKNLFILYDAVVTLADSVQRRLNQPELIQLLMPPLIKKWMALKDDDRALFPLLACLTSVAQAVGPGFQPYAEGIFSRCVGLIANHYQMRMAAQQNPALETPDREFVVCALDMLSGLADALEGGLEMFVANSNLLNMVGETMKDEGPDVRQSSFAFVGDLAKTCMNHLKPILPHYMPLLVANLNPAPVSVCNNAAWAIGEIAVKIHSEIEPWVAPIVARLVAIINQNVNRNLLENTGITLGRLGLVCPDLVAPHLGEFVQPWCFNLRNIRNDIEKEHAFQGLCVMIRKNPAGAFGAFAYVCDAISSWGNPKKELKDEFAQILQGFRQHIGDQWPAYYNQFPPILKNHLAEVYGLSG
eukprot:NODE_104_length_3154_cov_167.802775_g97_i0.p1 GENE.NODE_104_length_3154_cov_167.802775_g97_i0~~NODE_104_length_3154_cov_167.802775_g97_i0.p1  ORF type:complete len:897 (-),score=211.37 NODE_104_length_3154_cov_167.802775_g97_i0:408-3098(-)